MSHTRKHVASANTTEPDSILSMSNRKTTVERVVPRSEHPRVLFVVRQRVQGLVASCRARQRFVIPITLILLLAAVTVFPFSRYALLGLALKRDITVTIVDSQLHTPVSKATVTLGKQSVMTNAAGVAHLHVNVGYHSLTVSKQYYQTYTYRQLVGLTQSRNQVSLQLSARGRLLSIVLTNKLTGKPVMGATVKTLNSEAVTASNGTATVVLPAATSNRNVAISAAGYNSLTGQLNISTEPAAVNAFAMIPAGKLYFLSNLSGKIDVVKTDLDGSNRQTVLAGTGYESQYNTTLLASADWKYLALYAQRKATGNPEIDLIDTGTDVMSNIDEGNANFNLIGWDGDRLIYQVDRSTVPDWQSGHQVLKSCNAPTKAITILAQTTASGSNAYDSVRQSFGGVYIRNGKVIYALNWSQPWYVPNTSKQATLNSVSADGSSATLLKSFSASAGIDWYSLGVGISPYDGVDSLLVAFSPPSFGPGIPVYYRYSDGQIAQVSTADVQNFYVHSNPTYLRSPSGAKTFWAVNADGKNNLNVGDASGQNARVVVAQGDYAPYGWFTDNYLLLQKSGNELYILSADGSGQPLKVTDYYTTPNNYHG